jgi:hypothetical protein
MSDEQIEACRVRNQKDWQILSSGQPLSDQEIRKAVEDVGMLLGDYDRVKARAEEEYRSRMQWQMDLAEAKRKIHDLMGAVGPLRDKLNKARAIIDQLDREQFTPEEQEDMKDILREDLII